MFICEGVIIAITIVETNRVTMLDSQATPVEKPGLAADGDVASVVSTVAASLW